MSRGARVLGGFMLLQAACGDVIRAPLGDASLPDATSPPDDTSSGRVPCGAQVLPNGGFEDPAPAWRQDPSTPALLCGEPLLKPFQGVRVACLGLFDGASQTLAQDVPLPKGATMVTLTGQACIATSETDPMVFDVLHIDLLDGSTPIAVLGTLSNLGATSSCQFKSFTMTTATTSDPATATLQLRANLDAGKVTTFYLDALQLVVGCKP